MSKTLPGNQKHLNLDCRITIEKELEKQTPLRRIAEMLGKDPTTISKEIKKHRIDQPHNRFNESSNKCALVKECKKKNICRIFQPICKKLCRNCRFCNSRCPDFVPKSYHCPKLDRAPHVCNGCDSKTGCRLDKAYYRASIAQRKYRTVLAESRTGLNISEEELNSLDELITPLITQGHSPFMILQNHPEISQCEKTIYNYIDCGALTVKNIDLPKKVKYKVRNTNTSGKDDMEIFDGRIYKDFQLVIAQFPDIRVVEMDTVIGCEGSHKVLLTLHFDCCSFMMAYLLENKEAKNVKEIFDSIERAIGIEMFSQIFPVILTDRGGEFRQPDALECGLTNVIRTSIYYCDPMCSWQKPHCEKNHEYIRKICPKGSSFDGMTQDDVVVMMSHINSAPRESLGGMTPFTLAMMMLPKELIDFFGIVEILPDQVILTPELLKK